MALEQDVPVRIVRKNKRGHAGHHGGAWKVAYADFVTAMMALFIVLWIVGQSKQVKESVASYFKDPGAFFQNGKGGGGVEINKTQTQERLVEEFLKRQQQQLKDLGSAIMDSIRKQPRLKSLGRQISMELVKEGLRIELLETTESVFFDVGTAVLKPDAVEILSLIASEIGKLPNHLIVEGHTDSRPYSTSAGYTNFELSADRANGARRVLVAHGVHANQVDEVRGYADTQLKDKADPFDVSNRRISIIIKFGTQ